SVTNVALPHMQGSLSAGVEEMSWIITSFLAANAIIIPATGWLSGLLGRRRFFLICTVLFTVSSFLSGIAPNLTFLVFARVFQGLGGGPVIPISQAILWEIFPLRQRGMAMALWGVGIMLGPILGPTLGGWIADNWLDSRLITGLAVVAACAIVGFVFRELTCAEPILDLSVFNDRNFAIASVVISLSVFAFYASMLLLALYTQKLLAYDAWTSGLVLAPGGLGNMLSLLVAGRLVTRMDQRMLLATGCFINGVALSLMSNMTIGVDYWNLAWPRFVQGLGMGFVFVPLQTLALATVRMERLGNATAAFNVVRTAGGSVGGALAHTRPAPPAQAHPRN